MQNQEPHENTPKIQNSKRTVERGTSRQKNSPQQNSKKEVTQHSDHGNSQLSQRQKDNINSDLGIVCDSQKNCNTMPQSSENSDNNDK